MNIFTILWPPPGSSALGIQLCICWAQSTDLRNPWIHALYDDPWIAYPIHGLHSAKGAKLGFAQNMDWPN